MVTRSTLQHLSLTDALHHVDTGAAFADLRDVPSYLARHIPGSLSLLYEPGPGFQSRARDCLPLDLPLLLLHQDGIDMVNAAASLRGRGFSVPGSVTDGIEEWSRSRGTTAVTEVYRGPQPRDLAVLDVSDPGVGDLSDVHRIPVEQLWDRVEELAGEPRVVVASGYGIRAALAVGILERAGINDVIVWESRSDG